MNFVLMAYGPFVFSLSTFSYEKLKRRAEARFSEVEIIGAGSSIHRSGTKAEKVEIKCLFCPRHLAGNRGLFQVAAMRAALGQSYPILGNRVGIGDVLGQWMLASVEQEDTDIFVDGLGQTVEVEIELIYDGRLRSLGAATAFAGILNG